ncbi:MAG: hypothetical protein KatS3mg022_0796 [Armatimonadota bacterium]|nr:MAG: hypothetical protein KatS3mg022_0796 [Armatimonadota bacterium]
MWIVGFVVAAMAILTVAGHTSADSPLRAPAGPVMPGIIFKPTPPELVQLYRSDLSQLLLYLDDQFLDSQVPYRQTFAAIAQWKMLRWYAIERLGDTGTVGLIPTLEQVAQRYERQGNRAGTYREWADLLRLTIERIRLRSQGNEVYIQAMLRWIQTPEPAPDAPWREKVNRWRRVREGARVLGMLRVRDAVPVLIEWCRKPAAGGFADIDVFCARALARIGDKRALDALRGFLANWAPYRPSAEVPLEPYEPDIVWAYWRLRTDGVSLQDAVQDLLRSSANRERGLKHSVILEQYVGPAAIPVLLRALDSPPAGKDPSAAQRLAVQLLGRWRVREAVPKLLALLRGSGSELLQCACILALGQIGSPEALDELTRIAKQNQSLALTQDAVKALGLLGDPRAEPTLLDILTTHPNPNVRCLAAQSLATASTSAAIPVLERRLQVEPSDGVKGAIRTAIKSLQAKTR